MRPIAVPIAVPPGRRPRRGFPSSRPRLADGRPFSPAGPVRVAFAGTVWCELGGTETWHETLIGTLPPELARPISLAIVGAEPHPSARARLGGLPIWHGGGALRRCVGLGAEAVISWGLADLRPHLEGLGPYPRPVLIAVSHGDERSAWTVEIQRAAAAWADRFAAVSPAALVSVPEDRRADARVIRPGVFLPRSLAVAARVPTLGYAGRLAEEKRVDLILRALALLPGWRLVVVGDGPLKAELQSLAQRLGLADRVEWHGPRRDWWAVPHTVQVSASRKEGFGLVISEAAARGIPVIATDVGAAREIAGAIVLPADSAELPARIAAEAERLRADESHLARCTGRAREWIGENLSPAGRAREWGEWLWSLCRAGQPLPEARPCTGCGEKGGAP